MVKPRGAVAQFRDVYTYMCWGYVRVPGVSNLLLVYINRRAFAARSRFLRMATSRGFSTAVFDMIVNKRIAGTSLQQTS